MNILLDMDGVIADFHGAVCRLYNYDITTWPRGEYDIPKVLDLNIYDFYEKLESTPNFWINLEPLPWMRELYDSCREVGTVTITTSPTSDPDCLAQKVKWLRHHFHRHFTNFMIGKAKHLMANHSNILIDDSFRNIEEFRHHGGRAIPFPTITNELWYLRCDSCKHVKEQLRYFKETDNVSP